MRNPYSVLGVEASAGDAEIKAAYRQLAKKYHPDVNPDDPDTAAMQFRAVQEAYEVLSDPAKRRQFDQGQIHVDTPPRARSDPFEDLFRRGTGFSWNWTYQSWYESPPPPPPPPPRQEGNRTTIRCPHCQQDFDVYEWAPSGMGSYVTHSFRCPGKVPIGFWQDMRQRTGPGGETFHYTRQPPHADDDNGERNRQNTLFIDGEKVKCPACARWLHYTLWQPSGDYMFHMEEGTGQFCRARISRRMWYDIEERIRRNQGGHGNWEDPPEREEPKPPWEEEPPVRGEKGDDGPEEEVTREDVKSAADDLRKAADDAVFNSDKTKGMWVAFNELLRKYAAHQKTKEKDDSA